MFTQSSLPVCPESVQQLEAQNVELADYLRTLRGLVMHWENSSQAKSVAVARVADALRPCANSINPSVMTIRNCLGELNRI